MSTVISNHCLITYEEKEEEERPKVIQKIFYARKKGRRITAEI